MEQWKDIEGYKGTYKISSKGRIVSFQNGNRKLMCLSKKGIYPTVTLSNNGKKTTYLVSRLVAITFIPNPNNLPLVCHKDEELDQNGLLYNWVDNLWWGTYSDNMKDCIKKGRNNPLKKKVNQYSKNGVFIKEWGCAMDVTKYLGIHSSNIGKCCEGKGGVKSAGGFIWKYSI